MILLRSRPPPRTWGQAAAYFIGPAWDSVRARGSIFPSCNFEACNGGGSRTIGNGRTWSGRESKPEGTGDAAQNDEAGEAKRADDTEITDNAEEADRPKE